MEKQRKPLSVFVSHAKDDVTFARHLTNYLQRAKIRVWLAESELAVGDSIVESVDTAIRGTDVLVSVLSKSSRGSKWFQYEIETAQRNPDLAIIFVSIDGGELPPSFDRYPRIRGTNETNFPYEAVVDEIRRRFPDASDYEEPDDSIPEIPTMIGRDDALLRLEKMVFKHHFVAITGMAGIGKTTLAAAVARWARDTHLVDRVVWVHGNYVNTAGFITELQRALKVPEPGISIENAMDDIVASLVTTSTLIVLDDASDASHDALVRLTRVTGLDKIRVLVTCRSRSLAGAQRDFVTLDLDVLTADEAMTFLQDLLRDKGVQISVDDARQIVAETAGHPLAMSLIVGQIQAGTTSDVVLQRIRSSPSPEHYVPLFQTLDYTYDSLSTEERNVLSAIVQFGESSVSIRTVSTLSGIPDTSAVLRCVEALASRGVVRLDGDRISTHTLVRDYLQQRSDSSEATPQTLYVIFDPELMAKEDFVEFLETLNAIYTQLGGDELIIRENEIGHFTRAGVLV